MSAIMQKLKEFVKARGKKSIVGETTTHIDGSVWKKIADTGDKKKDWKQIKKGKKGTKKKKAAKKTAGKKQSAKKKQQRIDAGDVIHSAAKFTRGKGDRFANRAVESADLATMTEAEKAKHIRKESIWPPIDFDGLASMEPPVNISKLQWGAFIYAVKKTRDSFAAGPPKDTSLYADYQNEYGHELARINYTEAASSLKRKLELAIEAARDSSYDEDPERRSYYALSRNEEKLAGHLSSAIAEWRNAMENQNITSYKYTYGKIDRERESRGIMCEASQLVGKSMTGIMKRPFEHAINHLFRGLREVKVSEEGKLELAKKKRKESGEGPHMKGKPIASIQRTGEDYRNGKNVSEKKFLSTFGFPGVGYGNALTQEERQMFLNHSYDGLMDLARMIGVSPKAISLNGIFKMGFAVSGHGKAAAHYASGDHINITRDSGAGAMAHEWAHAVDDHIRKTMTTLGERSGTKDFGITDQIDSMKLSESGRTSKLPAAMNGVMNAIRYQDPEGIMQAMTKRVNELAEATKGYSTETTAQIINSAKRLGFKYDEGLIHREMENLRQIVVNVSPGYSGRQEMLESASRHIRKIFAAVNDGSAPGLSAALRMKSSPRDIENFFRNSDFHNLVLYAGHSINTAKTNLKRAMDGDAVKLKSKYLAFAEEKGAYWKRPHELFARAFETYIHDKISAGGERSDFLVHTGRYDTNPAYPQGSQRTHINKAFDAFVQAIDRSESSTPEVIKAGESSNIPGSVYDFVKGGKRRKEGEQWTQPSGKLVTKKHGKIIPVPKGRKKNTGETKAAMKEESGAATTDDIKQKIRQYVEKHSEENGIFGMRNYIIDALLGKMTPKEFADTFHSENPVSIGVFSSAYIRFVSPTRSMLGTMPKKVSEKRDWYQKNVLDVIHEKTKYSPGQSASGPKINWEAHNGAVQLVDVGGGQYVTNGVIAIKPEFLRKNDSAFIRNAIEKGETGAAIQPDKFSQALERPSKPVSLDLKKAETVLGHNKIRQALIPAGKGAVRIDMVYWDLIKKIPDLRLEISQNGISLKEDMHYATYPVRIYSGSELAGIVAPMKR